MLWSRSNKSKQFHYFPTLGKISAHGNHGEGVELAFALNLQNIFFTYFPFPIYQTFKFIVLLNLEHFKLVYHEISSYPHHVPLVVSPQQFSVLT